MSAQELPERPDVNDGKRLFNSTEALDGHVAECLKAPEFLRFLAGCELKMREAIVAWRVEPSDFGPGLTISQYQQLIAMLLEGLRNASEAAFEFYSQKPQCPHFKAEVTYLADIGIPHCAEKVWADVFAFREPGICGPFGIMEPADFLNKVRVMIAPSAERAIAAIMARAAPTATPTIQVNSIPAPAVQLSATSDITAITPERPPDESAAAPGKATGEKIKQLRTERAWNQGGLAQAADVSRHTVMRVEAGGGSVESIQKIFQALAMERSMTAAQSK